MTLRPLFSVLMCVTACVNLLGDDFTIESEGSGGGSAGNAGSANTGGSLPDCRVGEVGTCGSGKKCSVIDYVTGESGCITAGTHLVFTFCSVDEDCVDGTFCDPPGRVCLPVCTHAPCDNDGSCVQAATNLNGDTPVAGMHVCIANCDPLTGVPCSSAFGSVTCIPFWESGAVQQFHCWQGGSKSAGEICNDITECAVGTACIFRARPTCVPWCSPVGDACPTNGTCTAVRPPVFSNGVEYGTCFQGGAGGAGGVGGG